MQYAANLPPLMLAMGAALTMLCQSSTVAGAIAVAAANIGVIDFSGACWIVYGANLGSAANYLLLARSLGGEARQIVLIQVVQKLAGFIGIVLLLAVGWTLATPLAEAMTSPIADTTAGQVALVFLAYQGFGSLTCTLFFRQVTHWLEHIAPPTELEELSRPAFLIHEALVEPSFALDLVDREELRLMERLPAMLDSVRADNEGSAASPTTLRSATWSAAPWRATLNRSSTAIRTVPNASAWFAFSIAPQISLRSTKPSTSSWSPPATPANGHRAGASPTRWSRLCTCSWPLWSTR